MLIVPIKMKTLNMQRLSSERGVLTQWSNQAGCWSSRGVMGLFYTTVTHQNSSFSRKIPALPYSKETWDEDGRFQRKNKTTKIKWTIFLPTGSQYAWWVVCLFFFLGFFFLVFCECWHQQHAVGGNVCHLRTCLCVLCFCVCVCVLVWSRLCPLFSSPAQLSAWSKSSHCSHMGAPSPGWWTGALALYAFCHTFSMAMFPSSVLCCFGFFSFRERVKLG